MANGELTVKSRYDWAEYYLRMVRLRNPNAKTGPGEYYYVQAYNLADVLLSMSSDAKVIAGKISLQDRTGSQLDEVGRPVAEGGIGLPRPGAIGSSGAVIVSATASGTDIEVGDTLTNAAGVTWTATTAKKYYDGDTAAVICAETGPTTNQDPGVKLTWSSPRPGCFATAIVANQGGAGLTGGREAMGDDDYRELLAQAIANPAASANDATIQRLIQDVKAHGVAAEKAFTYNCVLGPSTTGFAFTLKGSSSNTSRLPSATQLNTVAAYVEQSLPTTDGLIKIPLADDPIRLSFRVKFSSNGWTDAIQWPPNTALAQRYRVSAVTSPIAFTVTTTDGVYTYGSPVAGQSIGLFSAATGKMSRKTIASVSGTGPWVITCDTLAATTDTSYLPVVGQWVSPWSTSLQNILDLSLSYVNAMGPGEATADLPPAGSRLARSPQNASRQWTSQMDGKLLGAMENMTNIQRATQVDGADYVCAVGGSAVLYLPRLTDFAVFPL